MKQEQIFTASQVEKLLDEQFKEFHKQWRTVINGSDLQTLGKFVMQVKEEINKPVANLC